MNKKECKLINIVLLTVAIVESFILFIKYFDFNNSVIVKALIMHFK